MAVDWDRKVLGPNFRVFGEGHVFLPAGGGSFPFTGVFDEQYRAVSPAAGMPVDSAIPVCGIRLMEFQQMPLQDDRLTRNKTGITYVVKDVQPDGHGWALLLLMLAP